MQFGSRGKTDGRGGGGAAAGAVLVAADPRTLLGLGLADLVVVETGFCEPNLDWLTGARGCGPTLVLVGAVGPLVARRGEDVVIVFMFLSSL